MKKVLFIFVLLCFVSGGLKAQDNWWKEKKYKTESQRQKFAFCKKSLTIIGESVAYNNVYVLKGYLNSEVYLNILDNDKGYYSADQTQLIMESFFNNYPVSSFKWKTSNRSETYAFAMGKYKFKSNGFINSYQLSVSLKYINYTWLIDQIIVN